MRNDGPVSGRIARRLTMLAMGLLLVACGGGGGSSNDGQTPNFQSGPTGNGAPGTPVVALSSDATDSVGGGRSYAYDTSNATILLTARGSYLGLQVSGAESWSADFQLPSPLSQLQPGTFSGLTRYPLQTAGAGALSWTGQGRGCNTLTGTIVIQSVDYQAGVLQALDMSFEQHCEGGTAALRGQIHVDAATMSRVAPLQNAQPGQPVVALTSQAGDFIGGGRSYAYDARSAAIRVTSSAGHLSVQVNGDEQWSGDFQLPGSPDALAPGSYASLTRYPFQAAGAGALSWSGQGSACNTVAGTLVIRSLRYEAGVLAAIDMDFEQRCDGAASALQGRIQWDAAATGPAPAPQLPPPAGLWSPPAGAMPDSGNAMYFASDPGDVVGGGSTYWVGNAPTNLPPGGGQGRVAVSVTENAGLLRILITGAVNWEGDLKAMDGLAHLQPGYYGIVRRYPFHNPARGGLSWTMDGRGCNTVSGWFVVDSIRYSGEQLAAVDLRFAQYCESGLAALRGRIRWEPGAATK